MDLLAHFRKVSDFPKPGIQFLDMSPVLAKPELFAETLRQLSSLVDWSKIDTVIGIESRGFMLGAPLASLHKKGFVPCRKAGKLPPPVIAESYDLEYGSATLEMQPGSGRALIVDDVLATGGTLQATLRIAAKAGYQVHSLAVLVNITMLNSLTFQGAPVPSVIRISN